MKKKIVYVCMVFLLLTIVVFLLSGCGNKTEDNQNADNQVNQSEGKQDNQGEEFNTIGNSTLAEAMNEHIKDEKRLNGTSINNYFNPQEFQVLESECKGIISMFVYDFDNDNQEECIIVRVKDNIAVEAAMYKQKNDKIKEVSSIVISEDVLKYGDTMNFDMFAKEINGEMKIFTEITQTNSLFSDGMRWNFVQLKIDNEKLIAETKENVAGSAFMPDEIDEYIDLVKETGLKVNSLSLDFSGKRIVEQNRDVVNICEIKREHIDGFDIMDYMSNSKESKVNFARTVFKDYVVDNELVSKE